jgi:protein-disulfide isomerase
MKKALFLSALLALAVSLTACGEVPQKEKSLTQEEAKIAVEKFINESLLAEGSKATIDSLQEENGLYKISVSLPSGQKIESYVTKDGQKFFTEGMDIAKTAKEVVERRAKEKANAEKKNAELPKTDKPTVELFVMSYCPFGTQIEKGILPVLDLLGKKIDFNLRFVDYAMHDKKEVGENLRQYCIQKESGRGKLQTYLKCFLKKGEGTESDCLKETKLDSATITKCTSAADKQFKISEKFNKKEAWESSYPPFDTNKDGNEKYGVQGSPTLILNGKEMTAGRDPASLLETICQGFKTPPAECEKQLSATQYSPGFGFDEGNGNSTSASCH